MNMWHDHIGYVIVMKMINRIPLSLMKPSFIVEPNTGTMYFDGAKNKSGIITSVDLLDVEEEYFYFAYLLDFPCTNNVAKHKAFILGLCIALDLGVTFI